MKFLLKNRLIFFENRCFFQEKISFALCGKQAKTLQIEACLLWIKLWKCGFVKGFY